MRRPSIVVLLLFAFFQGGCSKEPTPPPPPPSVIVAKPLQQQVVDWDDYAGRFEAVEAVEVRPRVSGLIQSVHFRDGQTIRKGELLFVIDPRPYAAALSQSKAQVERAKAGLANAEAELKRAQTLVDSKLISQSQNETRIAAQLQASAELAAAHARVEADELNLSFTRVIAPVAGRTSYRRLAAGNLVNAGDTLLTTIVTENPIHFVFDAPESSLLKYKRETGDSRNNPVEVRLQDERDYRWKGRIDFLDNAVDRGSGTIRGRAVLDNPDGFLTPGMFGHMRLMANQSVEALLVPDQSIVIDQTRQVAYVVDEEGVVAQKVVQPGRLIAGLRVIRSGLSAQDRVVISGVQRARPGRKVAVTEGAITAFPTGVSLGEESALSLPAAGTN
jgi:RND family efflux transporter MFP subunit